MVPPAGLPQRKLSIVRSAPREALDGSIDRAREALLTAQHPDGYWCFELEADCTIPAEYVMMMHYMDELDAPLQAKLAVYLRAHQHAHGGWPLYHGGAFDISCSVKAYFALKLAGDSTEAPHMVRARQAILAHGGAARANVFTRITLALFQQVPWRAVPFIPVEIMLLPRWFPFHLSRVSYWSRTVMVPLFILCSLKPRARNPNGVNIRELFTVEPEHE
jgi:squalene-hopene/tetraprenyl-beta-curcumene cyclase